MTTLLTRRLVLRPYTPGDFDAVIDGLNDFAISRNLARAPYPYHRSDAEDFHAFIQATDGRSLFCAVALASEPSRLRGFISYEWNESKRDAELGYWYERGLWGQGVATEAGHAMLHHAFEVTRHKLLVSGYHNDNPASGRVLEKLGFEAVGQSVAYSRAQATDVPTTRMRLTRARWQQLNLRQSQNTIRT